MTDEQEIYRSGNLTVSVTPDGIKVLVVNLSWVGGQGHRSVVPWSDILKHPSKAALVDALKARDGVKAIAVTDKDVAEGQTDIHYHGKLSTGDAVLFVPKDGAQ